MVETDTYKIALLIDADNISYKLMGEIISEAGKYGKVTIRRAYGDFTLDHLKNWKDQLNKYAIRPMQKFSYTSGKNSTDSAMIIDAMDIMHDNLVNCFCIASSDSDYTGLVLRIREEGLKVLGVGNANTPEAFQKACETFVYCENLSQPKNSEKVIVKEKAKTEASKPQPQKAKVEKTNVPKAAVSKIDKKPLDIVFLDKAISMALEEDGLAFMGRIGEKIKTLDPSFDTRTYGFGTMTALFKSMPDRYDIILRNNGTSPYVKPKL